MPPTNERSEYCDFEKNQYYVSQGQFCKQCDKCPEGLGKASSKERQFIIHPVHGAEGCVHCVRCRNGTYSDSFSFEPCKPCTDCQKEDRYMEQKCSSFKNSVCGKFIEKTTRYTNVVNLPMLNATSSAHNGLRTTEIYLITGLSSAFLFSMTVIAILFVILKYRRVTSKKKTSNAVDGDVNLALISNSTSTMTTSTTGSSDLDTDGSREPDGTVDAKNKIEQLIIAHNFQEEFSCKHANMISRYLVENNYFHQVGIELGVSDEDIKIIKTDYKQSVHEQAYETLIKWIHLKGSHATVTIFLQTLKTLELHNVIEKFCTKYDEAANKTSNNIEV